MRHDIVLGPNDSNPSDSIVAEYISECARLGDSLWHTMRHDTAFLWDSLALLTGVPAYTPYHVHRSYLNLHRMTRAWAYKSSPLYHNQALLADIRYGLDFLARNAYNDSIPHIGNWWEWQIGIPFDYCNIVCILYSRLSPEEIAVFDKTAGTCVRDVVVNGNLTYANQASVCRNLLFIGVLTKNHTYIQEACENAIRAFVDTTSIPARNAAQAMYDDILRTQSKYQHNSIIWAKEGLYPDGTFIQHIAIPYVGGYGVEMAELAADMALLFRGTIHNVPRPIREVLPLWITRTYLPAIYRGGFMTMFMGRGSYKRNPFYYARATILNIFRLSPLLPDSVREEVRQACRDMHLQVENIDSPYEKMDAMPVIARTIDRINRSGEPSEQDKPFSVVYAAGDRVVHQMKRARFGLAMSSNRIGKYEAFVRSMDSENATGWYTGDGMTFIYTPDAPAHYASYLLTANPYLIPGTTADRSPRQAGPSDMILFSHSSLAPDIARAGGACLNGLYSVAGMQLLGSDAELYAKKSWFMFDDEIVCLGSDIHQNRQEEVITVVENRITDAPWITAKQYAWLDKVAGYYFPENDRFATAVSDNGCREMTISHGIAPADGHYAYVLLPGFTERETKRYAQHPQTRIIAHTNAVHAVTKPALHLTAFTFFAEGKAAGLHADGPACVLMQRQGSTVTLAVSDPTWQRKTITLTLDGYAPVVINTENSMGQTHTLTIPDFASMRQAMRQEIVLGTDEACADNPVVQTYISECARIADSLRQTMRHDTTFLWDNLTLLTGVPAYTPYHVHLSYINLHSMTRAWAYKSSPLYHNQDLLADIRYGLDFLARNAYNDSIPHIGNWWEWQIGIPFDYSSIVCMLYDVLTQEEIETFDKSAGSIVYQTAVHGNLTYANQASVCRNLLFIGALTNNETYIREACDNAVKAFVDTTSIATRNAAQAMYEDILRSQSKYQHNTIVWAKEGLYPDGTFIQHIAIPYIGHYGCEMIELAADMVLLFKDTPFTIPQAITDILPVWITRSYLPAIYHGGFMTMFMGRTGYKRDPFSHARSCILNIFRVISVLPDSIQPQVMQACRDMHLELANIDSPYEKMDAMPVIAHTIDQINQSGSVTEQEKPFSVVYAAGDRVVHQMKRARFGLAMSSNRIGKYEAFVRSMDSENATGWYTGDGMTFIYTPDAPAHYASYLLTANPYLIPGTTADRSPRQAGPSDMILFSHSSLAPDIARAGGACLNGLYSVAGMQLLGSDAELYAKKSWFMFDDEIVCLGSDIHQNRQEEVITVVENRITDAPWITAKQYAWLDKVAGYYFPENDRFATAVSDNGCREMTISHGIAPADGHYAYVLLPGFTERETKRYAQHPQTRIIAHTNAVHAVTKPALHLTAFTFFAEGKAAGLHADGPACVLMQRQGSTVTLAVSDPTWQRKTITLTLDGYAPVVINTENSMGQTHTLTLKSTK